ncbi:leucine-rich repeat domain-containing protein [Seonamhaeicola sp.]|uniref:leucine-rich repeat domain-containing protein n=1 Tax=Seonamhaeicola sp. TaxID=1912245 RepID=UPI002606B6F2|nr:leucine-rich repeat domain-containing protein [Seonamhaeicola sp.]
MKTPIYYYIFFTLISLQSLPAQTFEVDGINYNVLNATQVEATSKSGCYTGDITIPATVDYASTTYNVTAIGYEAFRTCLNVTGISLPNSITEIKDYAFRDCRNITTITLPDSVTNIGEGAFLYCTELVSVNIPNAVTTIKMHTFSQCGELTSITIPELVTSIGTYAFSSCFKLTAVNVNINTPINIASQVFFNLDISQMVLNVPPGSETAYASASVWQGFGAINGTLSVNVVEQNKALRLYPNPVKDRMRISGLKQPETYAIYNVIGKHVAGGSVQNENPIHMSTLTNGLYFLKLKNGNTLKFIKE